MRLVGVLVVAVTMSCSSDKKDCATAGSRLHPRYRTTVDGLHEFIGWHDMQRDEDCGWSMDLDGTPRCVPGAIFTGNVYADAACTQPATDRQTCDTAKYAGADNTDCLGTVTLYSFGKQLTAIYANDGITCRAISMQPGHIYTALGAPVAPSEFVAGTVGAPIGTTRLRVQPYESEDGSVDACALSGSLYDSMRGETCFINTTTANGPYCLPDQAAHSFGVYSDSSCSMPVADVPKCTTQLPPYALAYSFTFQCDGYVAVEERVFTRAAEMIPSEYSGTPAACSPVGFPSPDPNDHYATGSEISLEEFVLLMPEVQGGSGRLKPLPLVAPDGYKADYGEYEDSARDHETCYFGAAADGQTRCLPFDTAQTFFYADAQCTTVLVNFPSGCSNPRVPTYAATYDFQACPPLMHVAPIGAAIAPPTTVYSKSDGGGCTSWTSVPAGTWYSTGAEVAPSSFVVETDVVE